MIGLQKREVTTLDVSNIAVDVIHPEKVVLLVDGERKGQKRFLDIGAFCYHDREKLTDGKKLSDVRLVNVDSIIHDRARAISLTIEHIRELICVEGKSHSTARGWFTDLTAFLDYCDFYLGEVCSFLNTEASKVLLVKYSHHLEHRFQLPKENPDSLNRNTAATKQRIAV